MSTFIAFFVGALCGGGVALFALALVSIGRDDDDRQP